MIHGYDFKKEVEVIGYTEMNSLLAGFLQAAVAGLEKTTEWGGNVESIKIGENFLIIKKGKHSFCVLITGEDTITLHRKLEKFTEQFETIYKKDLMDWNGDVAHFKTKPFQDLLYEYFRY